MMKVLLMVLGLVAACSASGSGCDSLARLKVKQQWAHAYGEGHHRENLGLAIWKAFFAHAPASRDKFFGNVHADDLHSGEFQAHSVRVLGGLDMVISLLDDEPVLNSQLGHLKEQHKERGISGNYFDIMGEVLLEVLPAQLGRCFDAHAWEACYDVIKHGIQGAH